MATDDPSLSMAALRDDPAFMSLSLAGKIVFLNHVAEAGLSSDPFYKNFAALPVAMQSDSIQRALPRPPESDFSDTPGAVKRFGQGVAQNLLPTTTASDIVAGPSYTVRHPIESAKLFGSNIADSMQQQAEQARQDIAAGNYGRGIAKAAASGIPIYGPAVARAFETAASGNIAGAAGQAAGLAAPFLAPEAIGSIGRRVAPALKESAASSMESAVGAPARLAQVTREKVVPALLEKGIINTRSGILKQADAEIARLGPMVGEEIKNMQNSGKTFAAQPLLDQLDNIKQSNSLLDSAGIELTDRPVVMSSIDNLKSVIKKHEGDFSPRELANIRGWWDEDVAKTTKGNFQDANARLQVDTTRKAANVLRDVLNTDSPNLATVNREYSIWQDIRQAVGNPASKTRPSGGLIGQIAQGAASPGLGFAVGGPVGAGVGMAVSLPVMALLRSTLWRTFSANQKFTFAKLLAADDMGRANALAMRLAAAQGVTLASKDQP